MKDAKRSQKDVKALKKVIDPAKAAIASKENGGEWAIGLGVAGTFVVPK